MNEYATLRLPGHSDMLCNILDTDRAGMPRVRLVMKHNPLVIIKPQLHILTDFIDHFTDIGCSYVEAHFLSEMPPCDIEILMDVPEYWLETEAAHE